MAAPTVPVPPAQMRAFGQRVMAYIGIDPAIVLGGESFNWSVIDDEGKVKFTAIVPPDDIIAMFNGEDRLPPATGDQRHITEDDRRGLRGAVLMALLREQPWAADAGKIRGALMEELYAEVDRIVARHLHPGYETSDPWPEQLPGKPVD